MTRLYEVRADVRSHLDEHSPAAWEDHELDRWINEACRDIARRSESLLDVSTGIQTIVGFGKYPLPEDVIRVNRVEFEVDDNVYVLEASNYQEMDSRWGSHQTHTSSYPYAYVLWGTPPRLTIQLYPVPSQVGLLRVFYYRLPSKVTKNEEVVDVPEGWIDLVPLYVEFVAKRRDRDPSWQEAKVLYEERLRDMIDKTRFFHDQASRMTVGPRGMPGWLVDFEDW